MLIQIKNRFFLETVINVLSKTDQNQKIFDRLNFS